MLQHLVLIKVDCTFLSLSPVNLCSYVQSTDAAVMNVVTASLSYRRVSYGYCYPHNLSSLQTAAIISCTTEMPSPAQTHRGRPWAGTYRQNTLNSNKQKRKSLPGPGSPVWDEIHREKHSSISPLSPSCSIHTHHLADSVASLPTGTSPGAWQLCP